MMTPSGLIVSALFSGVVLWAIYDTFRQDRLTGYLTLLLTLIFLICMYLIIENPTAIN